MNNQKSKEMVNKLYILLMVLFVVAAVINVLSMKGIFRNKVANFADTLVLVSSVFATKKITKLENGKSSGSMYVSFVVVGIAWFITYVAMWCL